MKSLLKNSIKFNLGDHYSRLYTESIAKIQQDEYRTDTLMDSPLDTRFGITLLVRPGSEVKQEIQHFLQELQLVEPAQYYYPASDMHVTVLSIISCYPDFDISNITIPDYVKLVENSIQTIQPFEIQFKGITASDSCIMLQGFPKNNMLDELRNNLRSNFRRSALEHSIDKRYSIKTAHATVVRFRQLLERKAAFLELLEKYRNYEFGAFKVENMELVLNDWYQRQKHVQLLHHFKL